MTIKVWLGCSANLNYGYSLFDGINRFTICHLAMPYGVSNWVSMGQNMACYLAPSQNQPQCLLFHHLDPTNFTNLYAYHGSRFEGIDKII